MQPIAFNAPRIEGDEFAHVARAVTQGHTSADGPFAAAIEEVLRTEVGSARVMLTTSCTAALELSAMLLDCGPGDTVVVPSFGFVTIASAFARTGARVRFCDIEPDTLGLDPECLAELLDDSVRAVVPIHYAGIACRVDEISSLVESLPRATVIEDNAHGPFGRIAGRPLGSFGRFSTLSFHETKNFTCGEGGALLLNDPADIDRAEVLFHKGTNRREFLAGSVDKYTWQAIGSSFGLAEILAAFLWGQLERRDEILERRRELFGLYHRALTPVAESLGLTLPTVPDGIVPGHHAYFVLVDDPARRDRLLADLRRDGVEATFHYVPLHTSPAGAALADPEVRRPCPVTEDISARLVRLPFHNALMPSEVERVVERLAHHLASGRTR